jgi:hypothetical protein
MRKIDRRDFLKHAAVFGGGVMMGGIPLPRRASAKRNLLWQCPRLLGRREQKAFVEESGFQKKFDVEMEYSIQIESVAVAKGLQTKTARSMTSILAFQPTGLNSMPAQACRSLI